MYINLYPNKHLNATKKTVLATGLFLAAGGAYALLRELFWQTDFQPGWAVASAGITLIGFLSIAVAMDKIRLKDAYLSITPERLMYRLSVMGREQLLPWENIKAMQVTEHLVVFEQGQGTVTKLRLGLIQQPEIARHVSRSILLAAMEKGIPINGALAVPRRPSFQE